MHSLNDIRTAFLEYFKNHNHTEVPSSPLVPHNDPTLMFTNAGMVQFKDVFSGKETRDYSRATSSQKCVRAGGKHNDLDNVGYTARHHTFFEMLGNFSFGDYFKEEAIEYAWEFVTNTLNIPKEKLGVTVYYTDDEAFELWKKLAHLPEEKILRVPTKDNFWQMADTGPCGPSSEIFYDHEIGEGKWQLDSHGNDLFGERFVEIWNLVFMQFEKLPNGEQIDLPKPSIDTGAGLERIAALMQDTHDNYETDLFQQLITSTEDTIGTARNDENYASFKVIADHLRSSCFLMADGVLPSNEGRGYVLRRIMRRAMRHAHLLGCSDPLMYKLVPTLNQLMAKQYPELERAHALITETLRHEEERFKETLDKGLKLLEEESQDLNAGDKLDGQVAFKLYDTYGFPLDLTQDIMRNQDIDVDLAGFDTAMDEQKAKARAAWKGSGDTATEEIWYDIRESHGASEFLGYEQEEATGTIIALVKDDQKITEAQEGNHVAIVINQTPFYGESGGQMGDRGTMHTDTSEIDVTDTKKQLGDLIVHVGMVKKGSIKEGDIVQMDIDTKRRNYLRAHHSATHLLHAALREILGDHVTQKGSQVEADNFRFDFSHPKKVTAEELHQIEDLVNHFIQQEDDVTTRVMTPEEAINHGAMALFGEKYGDEVRVLSMGKKDGKDFSVELCGGTHVTNTKDIELFKITSESAVASGIRRIEAVSKDKVADFIKAEESKQQQREEQRKASEAKKEDLVAAAADARAHFKEAIETAETIGNITFLGSVIDNLPAKELRILIDDFKQQVKTNGIVTIIATNEGKASIAVGVTNDLTNTLSAVDFVRKGAEVLGGKGGGGRPDMAQAGGPNASNANEAIEAIKSTIS